MEPVSGAGRHQLHWSDYPAGLWRWLLYKKKSLFRSLGWLKTFFWHACTTHTVASVKCIQLKPWQYCSSAWLMSCIQSFFNVCSQTTVCVFLSVADRAWVLLAVRPNIHKAILSLIDGDPLNYRLKQERRLQKTTLVKVFYEPPHVSALCVCTRRKKQNECQEDPKCIFLYFAFSFLLAVFLWSDPVWSCYYPGALSVCSCLFRSGWR